MADEARQSFDRITATYDRIRPSYPSALFDRLFALLPASPDIVEVGPGTGQATRDLLARGASVHAIEIGAAMAARLRANLADPRLRITVGAFEDAAVADRSADAVVSATAYHWVRAEAQTNRPARVLRPGGWIAVIDTIQVSAPTDRGFFTAVQSIHDHHGAGHVGPPAPTRHQIDPPMRATLAADDRFELGDVVGVDADQTYDTDGYLDLVTSYSGTQSLAPETLRSLLGALRQVIDDDFGGSVTRPLVMALTTARLA